MFLEREEYNFVITYDYVTKEPLKEDPNDNSGDFAFNVADAYNYNPQQPMNNMNYNNNYQRQGTPNQKETFPKNS